MTRKPIQIAVAPDGSVLALCDDATIWIAGRDWTMLSGIPQDPTSNVSAAAPNFRSNRGQGGTGQNAG